jgi:hypothetical protein
MVTPTFCEPLVLYIAATPRTASTVLITEQDSQVIAKEKTDTPCPGAPLEREAAVPASPREESSLLSLRPNRSLRAFLLSFMKR